jgi:hypothetical protein
MSTPDNRSPRLPGEPIHSIALPPDLAEFLGDLHPTETVCLLHDSDIGSLFVVKTPAREIDRLRGTYPIGLEHQLFADPHAPVIRTLLTFRDVPASPFRIETFTNVEDSAQHATFAALADQAEIPLLFYDECLAHRLSKRLRNATASQIPIILAEAERLLAAIPPAERDFDQAKANVWEVTSL